MIGISLADSVLKTLPFCCFFRFHLLQQHLKIFFLVFLRKQRTNIINIARNTTPAITHPIIIPISIDPSSVELTTVSNALWWKTRKNKVFREGVIIFHVLYLWLIWHSRTSCQHTYDKALKRNTTFTRLILNVQIIFTETDFIFCHHFL